MRLRYVSLVVLSACGPRLPGEVDVAISPEVPTALSASFSVRGDGPAWLRLEIGRDVVRTVPAAVEGGVARGPIVGLKADTRYRIVGVEDGVDRADVELRTAEPPETSSGEPLRFVVDDEASPGSDMADGFAVLTLMGAWSGVLAIDGEGDPVWWVDSEVGWSVAGPRLTNDGRALMWLENDTGRDDALTKLVRVELDGSRREVRWLPGAHHMVDELEDGEIVWPAWEVRDSVWDEGNVRPVLSDDILVSSGGGSPRVVFSFFEDLGPPYVPCSHGAEPDERLGQTIYEWTHTNSIAYIPERDSVIIGARYIDSLLEISMSTGEVIWQLGGRLRTMGITPSSAMLSHAHASDIWASGMLVFDNGNHTSRPSRVLEYAFDLQQQEITLAWEHSAPSGRSYAYLGDARRTPADHVLIAWSTDGRLEEVSRDHDLLWGASGPATVGRFLYLQRLEPPLVPTIAGSTPTQTE